MKKGAALIFCLLVSLSQMGAVIAEDSINKSINNLTAAPNLVGTWKGSAPYVGYNGINVGFNPQTVTLIIKQQVGNLLYGTCAGSHVVGRYYLDNLNRSFGLLWAKKSLNVSVSDGYTLYFLKTPPATL